MLSLKTILVLNCFNTYSDYVKNIEGLLEIAKCFRKVLTKLIKYVIKDKNLNTALYVECSKHCVLKI